GGGGPARRSGGPPRRRGVRRRPRGPCRGPARSHGGRVGGPDPRHGGAPSGRAARRLAGERAQGASAGRLPGRPPAPDRRPLGPGRRRVPRELPAHPRRRRAARRAARGDARLTALWLVIVAAACWIAFAYVGYPLLLALLARISPRPLAGGEGAARLSVIIAVHNGAHSLKRKPEQTLALPGPGPVEVLVASDGSTDDTDEIARSYAARGVRLVRNPVRAGKEAAQALGIAQAGGDVLVFTDVAAELSPDALREIARPF